MKCKCVGSSKVKPHQTCLAQPIKCILEALKKWVRERRWPNQLERERIKNVHFWSGALPAYIITFGFCFDFPLCLLLYLYHLMLFSSLCQLSTCSICTFTLYFFIFNCSINVICFTLPCPTYLTKPLIFLLPYFPLTLWEIPCHMCLPFNITMPPRIGAFPPNFPLENSFPLLLRRT